VFPSDVNECTDFVSSALLFCVMNRPLAEAVHISLFFEIEFKTVKH